jgi:hypothetical protein
MEIKIQEKYMDEESSHVFMVEQEPFQGSIEDQEHEE